MFLDNAVRKWNETKKEGYEKLKPYFDAANIKFTKKQFTGNSINWPS